MIRLLTILGLGLLVACGSGEKRASTEEAAASDGAEVSAPGETKVETANGEAGSETTLRGSVINEANKQIIKNAHLYLLKGEDKITETSTDALGRFEIVMPLAPGRYTLKVVSSRFKGILSFSVKTGLIENLKIFATAK